MKVKKDVYFSTDIEADGRIPPYSSMLSFASVVVDEETNTVKHSYAANLETLPGATGDAKTMEWWKTQPEAWEACRRDLQSPEIVIPRYVKWVKDVARVEGGQAVFVAYPAGFDFLYMYWYMMRFAGESPFSFSALDVKSYAMALLDTPFRKTTKKTMPKSWFNDTPKHNHEALTDALGQGILFNNMKKQRANK